MATRLLIVQVGNYAEAVHRFAAGGEETYYAQRYSVEALRDLASGLAATTVLSTATEPHDEVVSGGVRSIGMHLYPPGERPRIGELIDRMTAVAPTHLILASPHRAAIAWALSRGVRLLPWLADSFLPRGPRARLRTWRLFRLLKDRRIDWIGNHNVNSCLNLVRHGVDPARVVPWDWPPVVTPDRFDPKAGAAGDGPFRLIYVGQVVPSKGVGDCLEAVDLLKRRGREATLTVAGTGDVAAFTERAGALGVADRVRFLGRVGHAQVLELMREHDAVLVPSRHEYPEGLPMTIYEAYCARTPIVASDHPMFRGKVVDGDAGLIFPAGRADALAGRVEALASDPALYARLSANSRAAWERLQCPVRPHELFARWLGDSAEDRRWLAEQSLASGRYERGAVAR